MCCSAIRVHGLVYCGVHAFMHPYAPVMSLGIHGSSTSLRCCTSVLSTLQHLSDVHDPCMSKLVADMHGCKEACTSPCMCVCTLTALQHTQSQTARGMVMLKWHFASVSGLAHRNIEHKLSHTMLTACHSVVIGCQALCEPTCACCGIARSHPYR